MSITPRKTMSRAGSRQTRLMLIASIVNLGSVELHLWRLGHSLFIRHGKVRLLFHMEEELGRQVRGEIADAFVVLRHFLDVALARDGNAILCPFELTLEITKVLVGLQIWIILCNSDEAA